MKKYKLSLLLAAAALLCTLSSQAQSTDGTAFTKGSNIINLGIGIGTTLYGSGYTGSFPPISVSYERGIADGRFGIGGYLAHTSAKYGDKEDYWKYSYTVIGARGDYHFYTTDKLDTYGGVMLGYDIVNDKWHGGGEAGSYSASGSAAVFSIFVGGRYYFSQHVGAFAELGYGVAWLNLGLAFHL
jgi:hypothetical protein